MRRRILEEATRLFGAHGFRGTSIQSVADAVGIQKTSLLYHFSSKDELHEAVIERVISHWQVELPKLITEADGDRDRFTSIISAVLEYFTNEPERARLMLREVIDSPEMVRGHLKKHMAPWMKLLSDYIRMGQMSGACRSEVDPEYYLVQVLMMVIAAVTAGEVAMAMIDGGAREKMVEELVRVARTALFVDPEKIEKTSKSKK